MPDVPHLETYGVLSYDKRLRVYIGIAFVPDIGPRAGTGNRRKRHTVSDWINTLAVPQTPNL